MILIERIKYSDVNFKFISKHYDLHLEGTCLIKGETHWFKTIEGDFNEEKDEWEESHCDIYKLTTSEKVKLSIDQFLFEKCVGYHWSYLNGKKIGSFYYRNPKWIYKRLFNIYYKLKKQNQ